MSPSALISLASRRIPTCGPLLIRMEPSAKPRRTRCPTTCGVRGERVRALRGPQVRPSDPGFPRDKTSDQFFDVGQFDAYQGLGRYLGEAAVAAARRVFPRPDAAAEHDEAPAVPATAG